MSQTIDLNADVGEIPALLADGTQEAVMRLVSSVNIACGAHAGDEATIRETLRLAKQLNLVVGAHPSYPDREGFGRRKMELPPMELARAVRDQVLFLMALAKEAGVEVSYVKPHGALYNVAADDEVVAEAIGAGVSRVSRELGIVGLAGSPGVAVYRRMGLHAAGEGFIDRRYDANGRLKPRTEPDALISDPQEAVAQALRLVPQEEVDTLCIHAESPGAQKLAQAIRAGLESAGIDILRVLY